MSEAPDKPPTGIKRLEKKTGRFWGFLLRSKGPGVVEPLSPARMALRLRNLLTTAIKTTSSYVRNRMGDSALRSMFEYQGEQFASGFKKWQLRADQIARTMIKLNFQPFGMEAEYSGDAEVASIIVTKCPMPESFLQDPEFFVEYAPALGPVYEGAGEDLPTSKEWRERIKSIEACSMCRIVTPEVGEKLGFTWEPGLTNDDPQLCVFRIRVKPRKSK